MKTLVKSMRTMIAFTIVMFMIIGVTNGQTIINNKTAVVKIKTSAVCGSCKTRIEKNLAYEKGVTGVTLDLETKIVIVTYKPDKTDPDKLRLAISKIGYDADNVPADPVAYEKLPPCCKKDAEPHQ